MIRLTNVTKRYGATRALDQLTLTIPRGAMLGLLMSRLASRGASHVIAFVALGTMTFARDQVSHLADHERFWLADAIELIVRPIAEPLTVPLETNPPGVLPALAFTFVYACVLFALATWLFHQKDLLWAE